MMNSWISSKFFVLLALCINCEFVSGVPKRLFFPYGEDRGDSVLPTADDISSNEYQLQKDIVFYDDTYSSIFVNLNGHLSLGTDLPIYQPDLALPINFKVIAAFLADIDTRGAGAVYYRETQERAIVERAAADIQNHFSKFPTFEPTSLFIATWDNVGYYNFSSEKTNTFQIVIATDGQDSFVFFNYLTDGINWVAGEGKLRGVAADPPAQAGFDSGEGRLHMKLPHSGTFDVAKLAKESNINVPGVWIYQIGNLRGGNIVGPDMNTGEVVIFEPEVIGSTCLDGAETCSSNAQCIDFEGGYCCECLPPYYGNGQQCLEPGSPQRLNGKITGVLNGVTFNDLDMHAFVVTKDGRAYTAISRVPSEIGPQMLTLNTIGGIIGWLFALPSGLGAKNGYMFTGGHFNRTARIQYQSGAFVLINQQFFGHDALNNLRLETRIDGTVPDIGNGEKITVDDYKEEYRRVSTGYIRSHSDRIYRVNNVAFKYTWDQTIHYTECRHDPGRNVTDTMRLSVSRNFVVYDDNDRVVRFAMSNKIGVLTGADPCREGVQNCDVNADCIPTGEGSYRCECRNGFEGDGRVCFDIDECSGSIITCDVNARCYNVPGSFQCQCLPDFKGDGRICIRDVQLCGNEVCVENARCVYDQEIQQPKCECKPGFVQQQSACVPVSFSCNEVEICAKNAECVYDRLEQRYRCECLEGYSGDGEDSCTKPGLEECNCDPNADCFYDTQRFGYRCQCKEGYTGDGTSCTLIAVLPSICDDCHPNAQCVFNQTSQQYQCRCAEGFQGNGYRCEQVDCIVQTQLCDVNARCLPDGTGTHRCVCKEGYRGDGRRCEQEGCNVVNDCDINAQCIPDPLDTSRYFCRCNQGYEGNGKVCIRRVVPCNEVDNCSEFAECVYDPNALSYRCRCRRGYDGNGFTCTARGDNCRENPGLCDPNASCLLNVDTFLCVCNENYRGDGKSCAPISDETNFLFFSRGYSLHRVTASNREEEVHTSRLLYVPDELIVAVDSDCVDHKYYWSDVFKGRVSRANLDGSDKEVVVQDLQSPEGIAIDWLSRNIYITDSGLDIIEVTNMNGSIRKTLINTSLKDPRAIVIDPQRGEMYWTDWFRGGPTIEKAYMDGTNRKLFVNTDLSLPNGLTIDYTTQQICWGDAGVKKIECIRSDGVGRRVVTENAPYPFDITFFGNTLYWSDWTILGIPNINRDGGNRNEDLPLPVGGNGRLYGITSVREYCPRLSNYCMRNNGGCRFLCLPTPNGGRTCACPDNIAPERCNEIAKVKRK
ncbi:hypothetical protein CHS0354_032433 [Potamilus streckersoni]|uniref:Nidogen-1 n=1 Tax=Potamilus streckersoni TaxID=2493646 RepID=A0AAE0SPV7_9BIVA|nr:hypothetical protein CHS0354_032433 [Potamilus streckersoni]